MFSKVSKVGSSSALILLASIFSFFPLSDESLLIYFVLSRRASASDILCSS